ncbi:MAG: hypothetical protein KDB22_06780 [Planctomycetales bacterium]|nr:hypothetical protein [Planctomycetales bacterium]
MNDSPPQQGSSLVRFMAIMLASVVGGAGAGYASALHGDTFTYPEEILAVIYDTNSDVDSQEVDQWDRKILRNNTTLCATIAGALVVGLMGLVTGCFNSVIAAIRGLVVGVFAGSVAGALGGLAGTFVWQLLIDNDILVNASSDSSVHAAMANGIIWGAIGIAAGGASALEKRARIQHAIAGAVAGVLGACAFLLVAASLLISTKTELPLPSKMDDTAWFQARILWGLLPAAVIGLLVGRSVATNAAASQRLETECSDKE